MTALKFAAVITLIRLFMSVESDACPVACPLLLIPGNAFDGVISAGIRTGSIIGYTLGAGGGGQWTYAFFAAQGASLGGFVLERGTGPLA